MAATESDVASLETLVVEVALLTPEEEEEAAAVTTVVKVGAVDGGG